MAEAGQHSHTQSLDDQSSDVYELLVHGASILALVAAHGILAAAQLFAARLLIARLAVAFGFQAAKLSKFVALSTAVSLTVSKFLTQYAELFASHKLVQLTTALLKWFASHELKLSTTAQLDTFVSHELSRLTTA